MSAVHDLDVDLSLIHQEFPGPGSNRHPPEDLKLGWLGWFNALSGTAVVSIRFGE